MLSCGADIEGAGAAGAAAVVCDASVVVEERPGRGTRATFRAMKADAARFALALSSGVRRAAT